MRRNERGREERKTRMGTALSAAQLTAVTTESNRRCSTELCAGLGAEVAVGKSVEVLDCLHVLVFLPFHVCPSPTMTISLQAG